MTDAIAWVDAIAPEQAVGVCGAKMGRLAELIQAGVTLPQGFTVTVDAYRQHCAQAGLDQAIDAAFAGLGPQSSPGEIEAAAQTAYDVIVLDRDLPVVHGDRVCRTLAGGGLHRVDQEVRDVDPFHGVVQSRAGDRVPRHHGYVQADASGIPREPPHRVALGLQA